ncbi:DUF2752 domain-containing protein [Sedimentisphaera salicampi]|uniref:DUF2752 domain-containing protein n=1 Tax=Sedimentisphaera salicampi TaxID=1941349 RepID=UPI000B9AB2BF|nr:DUF2752 domain-containing protein [Sedimentisphaera salicampi]
MSHKPAEIQNSGTFAVWRWIVFICVPFGWFLIWLMGSEIISGESIFGICGFRQKHDLPCPFCGMTTSAKLFLEGNFLDSLKAQPAGFILCIFSIAVWVESAILLIPAVRRKRSFFIKWKLRVLLLAALVIILLSWGWKIFYETIIYE